MVETGACLVALPLEGVIETMRPLRTEPLAGMPDFLLGLALIRGAATPVVDLAALLGQDAPEPPARFVTVRAGERVLALAVAGVREIRSLPAAAFEALPPLAGELGAELIAGVAALDARFLMLLQVSRAIPEALWAQLENPTAPDA